MSSDAKCSPPAPAPITAILSVLENGATFCFSVDIFELLHAPIFLLLCVLDKAESAFIITIYFLKGKSRFYFG